jgi:hypothetical protein
MRILINRNTLNIYNVYCVLGFETKKTTTRRGGFECYSKAIDCLDR